MIYPCNIELICLIYMGLDNLTIVIPSTEKFRSMWDRKFIIYVYKITYYIIYLMEIGEYKNKEYQ